MTKPALTAPVRGLKHGLLSSAAASLVLTAGPVGGALAQQSTEVAAETTAPLLTSATGDLTITAEGSVVVSQGAAVTIDADADVVQDGALTLETENDDAIGVLVTGDVTGSYAQTGSITVTSELETVQNEAPADFPGGRFGFLVAQDARLDGDVTFAEGSSIAVDSAGGAAVSVLGEVTGDLTVLADISVQGEDAIGVHVAGDVGGDALIGPAAAGANAPDIQVRGVNASGVVVDGDVGGRLTVARTVGVTGFTSGFAPDDDGDDDCPIGSDGTVGLCDDVDQATLASGNALRVSGTVSGGVLLAGATDTVAATEDTAAIPATGGADLSSRGGGAAVFIADGAALGALTGEADAEGTGYGLFNGGTIEGSGATGFGSAAVSTTGLRVGAASIAGGIGNAGGIGAQASGLSVSATALVIEAGASVPRFDNDGSVLAIASSDTGDAVAVRDASGSVLSFSNTGTIQAVLQNFSDGDTIAPDGEAATDTNPDDDEGDPTGRAIAVDLSAATSAVTFDNTGSIFGDVLLGDGGNTVTYGAFETEDGRFLGARVGGDLYTGDGDDTVGFADDARVAGDVFLGGGADVFTLAGEGTALLGDVDFGDDAAGGAFAVADGARFIGGLLGGQGVDVDLSGTGSRLELTALSTQQAGSLTTGDGTILSFHVSDDGSAVAALDVAGDVDIAGGTEFETVFDSAFVGDVDAAIITAGGTLTADLSGALAALSAQTPFLFDQSVAVDSNAVVLSLSRKDTEDLGIAEGIAPGYEPFIAALAAASAADEVQGRALGRSIFNLPTQERFLDAYRQFLGAPLDAPLTYAVVQNDSVTSVVNARVDRLRDDDGQNRHFWLQEESFFVNRNEDDVSNGFDGGGFVIALGADAPLGPVDTVGVSASVASARYDEQAGEDFPFNRLTYAVSAYASERIGQVRIDGRLGYGWSQSDSERNIVLTSLDENGQADGMDDIRRTVTAEWDGTQLSAYGRVLYEGQVGGYDVQPFASLDYLSLTDDAYAESGVADEATALTVSETDASSLRGNLGVMIGKEYKLRPSRYDTSIPGTVMPRLTAAISQELDTDDIEATYRFAGGDPFTLAAEKEQTAGTLGADVLYENQYAKLHAGVAAHVGDKTEVYTLRLGVGLKW